MYLPRVVVVTCATGAEFKDWTDQWRDSVGKTVYAGEWFLDIIDDGGEMGIGNAIPKTKSISTAFNAAIELGLKHDPDYVCLMTTSTRPTQKEWLEVLVRHLQAWPNGGIAGTRSVYSDGTLCHAGFSLFKNKYGAIVAAHLGRETELHVGIDLLERRVEAVTGACMLFSRRVLGAGVRFDESIIQNGNDVDICLQARAKGFDVVFCPHVTMWREPGHTRRNSKYQVPGWDDVQALSSKWQDQFPTV